MSTTTALRQRPSLTEGIGAVACGVLALGGAIVLPFAAAAEPVDGMRSVSPADTAWWIVLALALIQSIALLWAGRLPRLVLSIVTLIPLAHAIAIPGDTFSLTTIGVSFGVFWAVVREPLKRLGGLLPAVALLVAGSQILNDTRSGGAFDPATIVTAGVQAIAVIGIPLLLGLFFSARRDARVSRRNELLAMERERDALIDAAVSRERVAMSRELHDIAAHHVSGIALLASAIYRQIDSDPPAAKLAAQQVRTQSTSVLDDLRRVIGLLRDGSDGSRSVETLAAVPELVESRRSAGAEVRLDVLGRDGELGEGIGPLAQLVGYRMVQESLANASVHAPGASCVVEIDDRMPDRVTLLVANAVARAADLGPGGGFGLVGMRERADLVGAQLTYGSTRSGGWEVRLIIPRDATIAEPTEELA